MKKYKDVKIGDKLYALYSIDRYEYNIMEIKVVNIIDNVDDIDDEFIDFFVLLDGCYVSLSCLKESYKHRDIIDIKDHDDVMLDIYTEYEEAKREIINIYKTKLERIKNAVMVLKNSEINYTNELNKWENEGVKELE